MKCPGCGKEVAESTGRCQNCWVKIQERQGKETYDDWTNIQTYAAFFWLTHPNTEYHREPGTLSFGSDFDHYLHVQKLCGLGWKTKEKRDAIDHVARILRKHCEPGYWSTCFLTSLSKDLLQASFYVVDFEQIAHHFVEHQSRFWNKEATNLGLNQTSEPPIPKDNLYQDALAIAQQVGRVSVSMLVMRLGADRPRVVKLVEALVEDGILIPEGNTGEPRYYAVGPTDF